MDSLKSLVTILLMILNSNCYSDVEELSYYNLVQDEEFEIRQYSSHLRASIEFKSKKDFNDKAFKNLFSYISGENSENEKIEMTTPVLISKTGTYKMSFILPKRFTLQSVPLPTNNEILIHFVDEKKLAAIKFSGFMWDFIVKRKKSLLKKWVDSETNFKPTKGYITAGYDAPWVLPFWRRNEVLIEVKLP